MNQLPLISICIPAYKNTVFLNRLLDSIAIQTYTNYEVIITDDSPDDTLEVFIGNYPHNFLLRYYRNAVALGTPENWNESIRKSRGEWIKLMHDDDWFASSTALGDFAAATLKGDDFIFSAYENIFTNGRPGKIVNVSVVDTKRLKLNPVFLLARNLVGPPSVTLYKKSALVYDKRMKWKVDIDFYMQYLKDHSFSYIDKPLIKVGIGAEQVTQSAFLVPEVEIPENFLLLGKIGVRQLRNWLAFDSWWRLFRNLRIRSVDQIRAAGYAGDIPGVIEAMLRDQRRISLVLLKVGILSKCFMTASYIRRFPLMK